MISQVRIGRHQQGGAALIIVLTLVVLLTGVVVAYFNLATTQRAIVAGTFGTVAADVTARGAIDVLVNSFQQEIIVGSNESVVNGAKRYEPKTPNNVSPQRNGSLAVPNLIRVSLRNDPLSSPAQPSVASEVNSAADPDINGRNVSGSRWNGVCLLPMNDPTTADNDPVPIAQFTAPDWVYLTAAGPTANPAPASVFARYAYAVYDEGGLLDANIAGLPSPTPGASPVGRKGIVALADPRGLPYRGSSTATSTVSINAMAQIVGWRNSATLMATPTSWPSWTAPADPTAFTNLFLSTNQSFLVPSTTVYQNRTDQLFLSRTELLNFNRLQGTSALDSNSLTCLGTFSRERNLPTRWLSVGPGASSIPPVIRFPLSDLATLTQAKFGLVSVSAPNRWRYVGAGAAPAIAIAPLSGGQGDFFQLLQYARSTDTNVPGIAETLSIGASIIDQYDGDIKTTEIEYDLGSGTLAYAYGMEAADTSRPPAAPLPPTSYPMWNEPFRNVGELGYAYKASGSNKTVEFASAASIDGPILDIFTYNTAVLRAGQFNLNTQNPNTIEAMLKLAWQSTAQGSGVSAANARNAAVAFVAETRARPALGRQDLPRIIAAANVGSTLGSGEEARETVARAISESCTTRTWGLLIDVVAQSGRCVPGTTDLARFVVDGEKRYWLHIAIDRFTGEVIDQQLEAVYE